MRLAAPSKSSYWPVRSDRRNTISPHPGIGTVPTLVAVGLLSAAAGHRFRRALTVLTPAVLLFNSGLLALSGIRLLAGS